MTRARLRIKCIEIAGESNGTAFRARVQTVEGENLSPKTMAALQAVCGAAVTLLDAMPEPTKPLRPSKYRKLT